MASGRHFAYWRPSKWPQKKPQPEAFAVRKPRHPAIISIEHATFFRNHPSSTKPNPPLFPDTTFYINSDDRVKGALFPKLEIWAVIGPSSSGKTTFLQILRGQHVADPPLSRKYPLLSADSAVLKNPQLRIPSKAIQYVGFGEEEGSSTIPGTRSAYLSARYESLREETDWTLRCFLEGKTELNPYEEVEKAEASCGQQERFNAAVSDLKLADLLDMPVANLSNGQTRRAMIAKALLSEPLVLLLDEVFMGLDPPTQRHLSDLLGTIAKAAKPQIVLSLRPQDPVPNWVNKIIATSPGCKTVFFGPKSSFKHPRCWGQHNPAGTTLEPLPKVAVSTEANEPLVEMNGVKIAYGGKVVLGNWRQNNDGKETEGLHWTVRRGQRWAVLGTNGSGKTTLFSLICSDHPQTYAQPVKLFGRSRIPERGQPGISVFDIQARIGHSSPEIHHHIPPALTLHQVIASAWADTFLSKPQIGERENRLIDECLRWFGEELNPSFNQQSKLQSSNDNAGSIEADVSYASKVRFKDLPFSAQRVALFLRAIIKSPDLVILDEAFSGMDIRVRTKCMSFLHHGAGDATNDRAIVKPAGLPSHEQLFKGLQDHQALICIGHDREEIPWSITDWLFLPAAESEEPATTGRLAKSLCNDVQQWNEIWGMSPRPVEAAK